MGLAASQARLLSITSRISDNELRAQLINNQKMRLSAESSQVSENYINALNKTKLMFANYDSNDNAQNVPLTFNNLTAFNQYNNQYGLTNNAGNILISETEAKYYQASVGAADPQAEFLKQHGIEYTTSYWDTLQKQLEDVEDYHATPNGDGEVTSDDGAYNFYTSEQFKNMYEGYTDESGNEIASYADTIKTKEYTDFEKYADDFEMAIVEISNGELERATLQNRFLSALLSGTYSISDLSSSTAGDIATKIGNNFNGIDTTAITTTLTSALTEANFQAAYPDLKKIGSNYYTQEASGASYSASSMSLGNGLTLNINTAGVYQLTNGTAAGTVTLTGVSDNHGTTSREISFDYTDPTDGTTGHCNYLFNNITGGTADVYAQVDSSTLSEGVTEYIQSVASTVIDQCLSNGASVKTDGPVATDPSNGFTAEELELISSDISTSNLADIIVNLATTMFGTNANNYITYTNNAGEMIPAPTIDEAYQLLAILNYLTAGNVQWQSSGTQHVGKDIKGNDVSFDWSHLTISQSVINAYALDTMMNLFGEPVYGYMKKDSSGNWQPAEEEATWYINLFDKIQSSGYQVLANGLASSTEWLQFALENGIVVMEQINGEGAWQGITYTSCSDISEQTDTTATTIAEAEYNKAMRQIEAKDEMYDLELKNIDTEHSSLEAEYESVKKAMSGNIERNFQMYS